jgi:phospholipid N-methyltransferase
MPFYRKFFNHFHHTGAIAPSGPNLAKHIVRSAGVTMNSHVLELGPGTGAFTRDLEKVLGPGGDYLGIEINADFHSHLQNQHPKLHFEQAPGQDFDFSPWVEKHGQFDVIVSGLPWARFPEELQRSLLDNIIPHLKDGGTFVTFAYTGVHLLKPAKRFRRLLDEYSADVKRTRSILLNFPPAFVFVVTK